MAIASSVSAYAVSVLLMRRSILTERIARRGRHILQEYSVDPLDFLQAREDHDASDPRDPAAAIFRVRDAIAFFREAGGASAAIRWSMTTIGCSVSSRAAMRLQWQVEGAPPAATLAEVLSDASQPFAAPGNA